MIAQVESRLREIEGGHFQKVCNLFVSRKYRTAFAPGSQIETYKTTAGTPDAFFIEQDGSYTFIEYTTTRPAGLKNKIKTDLLKCFNYVDNSAIRLSRIIYFHSSHTLSAKDHSDLTKLCLDNNCVFEMYDVAVLASELLEYPFLIRDELNLPIDTGQIMTIDRFVEKYNNQKLTTPLDINLVGRENDVKELVEMISTQDVVLLFGKAGLGKTRLAIEVCRCFAEQNIDYSVLCIFNNDIDLIEDYNRFISIKNNYLIFVDDCNQISSFRNLLEYVWDTKNHNVKIIATVRDYAKDKVLSNITINQSISFSLFGITRLLDESIKGIINNFGIINHEYLDRIVDIAQGNPRLAVIASKVAIEGTLSEIFDATQLMEQYYDEVLNESELSKLDIVIGACTYLLKGVNFSDTETFVDLLGFIRIDSAEFHKHALEMHNNEMIDFCENVAIKPSEQILSCYLAYCALFKYQYLSLSEFLITFFNGRSKKITDGLNGVFTYYRNDNILEIFRNEIEKTWNYFEINKPELLNDFISAFHTIKPEKSLVYLKRRIQKLSPQEFLEEYSLERNHTRELPIELQMLGNYSESNDWEAAIDLVFEYAEKRQNEIVNIIEVLTNYSGFGIKETSQYIEYREQIYIYQQLLLLSETYSDVYFTNLLLEISKVFLNIGYEFSKRKNANIVFGEIPLSFCDSSRKLREMVWKTLITLVNNSRYRNHLIDTFHSYDLRYKFTSSRGESDFAHFDLEFLKELFNHVDQSDFEMILSLSKILMKLELYSIETSDLRQKCLENEVYKLYYLLVGEQIDRRYISYDEQEKNTTQELIKEIKDYDTKQYIEMLEIWNCIDNSNISSVRNDYWELSKNMEFVLIFCLNNANLNHLLIFSRIITMKINRNLSYYKIILGFINKCGASNIEEAILSHAFGDRLFLRQIFLDVVVHNNLVTVENISHLIKIFDDFIFKEIRASNDKIISFDLLKSISKFRINYLIETLKRIKSEHSDGFSLFDIRTIFIYNADPSEYIKLFKNQYVLLKELYFIVLRNDQHFDYSKYYFKAFVNEQVISISEYINFIKSDINHLYRNSHVETLSCIWELEKHHEYVSYVFNLLTESQEYHVEKFRNIEIFSSFFKTQSEKYRELQDLWITENLTKILVEANKMDLFFEVLSEFPRERFLAYIKMLLEHNISFEIFEKLRFEPRLSSWSGSELPQIDKRLKFLEAISELLVGAKFIEHKQYVVDFVSGLKLYRKRIQIREFLEDY